MCLRATSVRPYQKWTWGGHQIVQDPIIPNARTLPASGPRRTGYTKKPFDIDARQFLSIDGDAVVQAELAALTKALSPKDQAFFRSRKPRSFDFRVRQVLEYLDGRLRYFPSGSGFDPWLFPGETFGSGGGDCEDLAFALYALLRASGVSDYCLRVAFGIVRQENKALGKQKSHHAWVMYKDEAGSWRILEPLALCHQDSRPAKKASRAVILGRSKTLPDVEYTPHFVLNPHHLWNVQSSDPGPRMEFPDYIESRKFWEGFNPAFASGIHDGIFDDALPGIAPDALKAIKSIGFWVDVEVLSYDPRDHFDFAYVKEGWDRVNQRLARGKLKELALALHAVGDFYAHTLYAKFAPPLPDGSIPRYQENYIDPARLVYDFTGFDLPDCKHGPVDAANYWKGRLISGQWWRWFTTFPGDLKKRADFKRRFCLPDHDQVAVDGPDFKPGHCYFKDPVEYAHQFAIRRGAAVEHIADLYRDWVGAHGQPVVPPGILGPQHK